MKKQNKAKQKTTQEYYKEVLGEHAKLVEQMSNSPGEEFFKHKLQRIAMWREFRLNALDVSKLMAGMVGFLGLSFLLAWVIKCACNCYEANKEKDKAVDSLQANVREMEDKLATVEVRSIVSVGDCRSLGLRLDKLEHPEPVTSKYYIEVTNSIIHPLLTSSNMFWISRTNQLEFVVTNNIIPTHINSIWIYKTNY